MQVFKARSQNTSVRAVKRNPDSKSGRIYQWPHHFMIQQPKGRDTVFPLVHQFCYINMVVYIKYDTQKIKVYIYNKQMVTYI